MRHLWICLGGLVGFVGVPMLAGCPGGIDIDGLLDGPGDDDDDDDAAPTPFTGLGSCTPAESTTVAGIASTLVVGGTTCRCTWSSSDPYMYDLGTADITAASAKASRHGAKVPWSSAIDVRSVNSGPFSSRHNAVATSEPVAVAGDYTAYLTPLIQADGTTLQPCSTFGTVSWEIRIDSGPSSEQSAPKQGPGGILEDETTCTEGQTSSSTFRLDRLPGSPSLVPLALEPAQFGGAHVSQVVVEDFGTFSSVTVDTPTGTVVLDAAQASASFAPGDVALGSAGFTVAQGGPDASNPVLRIDTTCEPGGAPAEPVGQAYVLDGSAFPYLAQARLLARVDLSQGPPMLELGIDGLDHRSFVGLVEEGPDLYRIDLDDGQLSLHGTLQIVGDNLNIELEQTSLQGLDGGPVSLVAPKYGN